VVGWAKAKVVRDCHARFGIRDSRGNPGVVRIVFIRLPELDLHSIGADNVREAAIGLGSNTFVVSTPTLTHQRKHAVEIIDEEIQHERECARIEIVRRRAVQA